MASREFIAAYLSMACDTKVKEIERLIDALDKSAPDMISKFVDSYYNDASWWNKIFIPKDKRQAESKILHHYTHEGFKEVFTTNYKKEVCGPILKIKALCDANQTKDGLITITSEEYDMLRKDYTEECTQSLRTNLKIVYWRFKEGRL